MWFMGLIVRFRPVVLNACWLLPSIAVPHPLVILTKADTSVAGDE